MFLEVLERIGNMPLPPYINRKSLKEDKKRYQTVYCEPEGSVAAPTAGLHFTDALLEKIKNKGVNIAYVTLHVGIGTFRPVKCDNIEEHHMHFEQYCIDEKNAEIINETQKKSVFLPFRSDDKCRLHRWFCRFGVLLHPEQQFDNKGVF